MFDSTYDYSSYDDGYYDNRDDYELDCPTYRSEQVTNEDYELDDNEDEYDDFDDYYDDSMDGDFDSGMRDAGFGTDEDYGYYGEDY